MKYRKLRIAWSVAWGVLAVLLCLFWVRSLRIADDVTVFGETWYSVTSARGLIRFDTETEAPCPLYWSYTSFEVQDGEVLLTSNDTLGFRLTSEFLTVPHWFVVTLAATLGLLPWLRWHFSLRTLLIATTLVAVGLGVVVWLMS